MTAAVIVAASTLRPVTDTTTELAEVTAHSTEPQPAPVVESQYATAID